MCKSCNVCNGCDSGVSRRSFLGMTGAVTGGLLLSGGFGGVASADQPAIRRVTGPFSTSDWDQQPPVRIYVVYLGVGGGPWPEPAEFVDTEEIQNVFAPCLDEIKTKLGDVEFVGGDLIPNDPGAASALLPKIAEQQSDAILVIHLAFGWSEPFLIFESTGLPVAIYSQPFSGHDWMYVPRMQREGRRIIISTSHDLREVERLVRILRVPPRMKNAKIVCVAHPAAVVGTPAARNFARIKAKFGTEVIAVPVEELVEIHRTIPDNIAIAEAEEYWISQAKEIREPSREEIIKSCKTYFALKQLMERHRAIAITMQCLGTGPTHIIGYPCLAFSRILDGGGIGACEVDMDSTLTMMLMLYSTGLPGFLMNTVMEHSTNSAIHTHCVATTKMAGFDTERLPFTIRTHTETLAGAAVRVLMSRDIGQEITRAKLANLETILASTGVLRGDFEFGDRGCRTRVITDVTSSTSRELFDKWGGNVLGYDIGAVLLHRVMFYGDHLVNFRDIAQLMGLKVMIEGKDFA